MNGLKEFAEKLKNEKSVAVFCHVRPDGDAVGSACAISAALNLLGVKSDVYCADEIPRRFFFLPEAKNIKRAINCEYSAYLASDCADELRLGDFAPLFSKRKNTYNIDHHITNTRYAANNFVFDSASNCENAFALINEMGAKINKNIAQCLATGVTTDTGGFRHKNVTENTFETASKLLSFGADFNEISYYMFTLQSKERAALFGKAASGIRYLLDGRLAIATVRKKDLEETGAMPDETEGFVDFIMGIEGVEVGICLLEMGENRFKASMRSKKADVSAAASSFGGGGHKLAAGCQINAEYEEAVDLLRFAIYKQLED